jgi:ABC-type multidrug transport system fused ATPase/permease subunit
MNGNRTTNQNRVREALGKIYDQEPPYFREYLRRFKEDPTSRVFAPLADGYRRQGRLDEAIEICRELGLGPLLKRMPAGINEFIGDTGWHLSQGERSRIFLARALLQRADVIVLDESLAALDPENVRQCLRCVMRRAPTAIVIAHP